jgi:hypothetical protein
MTFEILAIIVFLNVAATITLWRTAARRPEKLKKKFLNRLWRGKPITRFHGSVSPAASVKTAEGLHPHAAAIRSSVIRRRML